jgi:hypothetical protein
MTRSKEKDDREQNFDQFIRQLTVASKEAIPYRMPASHYDFLISLVPGLFPSSAVIATPAVCQLRDFGLEFNPILATSLLFECISLNLPTYVINHTSNIGRPDNRVTSDGRLTGIPRSSKLGSLVRKEDESMSTSPLCGQREEADERRMA